MKRIESDINQAYIALYWGDISESTECSSASTNWPDAFNGSVSVGLII